MHCCDSEATLNYQKLHFSRCRSNLLHFSIAKRATGMSFSCRYGLFGIWWSWTYCASNSIELEQLFMPMWLDLTTVPFGNNARHFRDELSPCYYFLLLLFCHQLIPIRSLILPPVPSVMCCGVCALCCSGPFRRVGWFWRSVCSPPPLRCFGLLPVVGVRFFPLAFQAGCVCVCNIWIGVKLLFFLFLSF